MRATDIVAWHWDGAVYCDDCMSDDDKEPEAYEGVGGPVFANDETWQNDCCGACGHALTCKASFCIHVEDCFPCHVEKTADALREALSGIPIGVAMGALRTVLEPLGYHVNRIAEESGCTPTG